MRLSLEFVVADALRTEVRVSKHGQLMYFSILGSPGRRLVRAGGIHRQWGHNSWGYRRLPKGNWGMKVRRCNRDSPGRNFQLNPSSLTTSSSTSATL